MKTFNTPDAAQALGISSEKFRRLAKQHGLKPVGWYSNTHVRRAPPCPLWSADDVDALRAVIEDRNKKYRNSKKSPP